MDNPNKNKTRVCVYLDDKEARALKSILALQGISISSWLRRVIIQYIIDNTD